MDPVKHESLKRMLEATRRSALDSLAGFDIPEKSLLEASEPRIEDSPGLSLEDILSLMREEEDSAKTYIRSHHDLFGKEIAPASVGSVEIKPVSGKGGKEKGIEIKKVEITPKVDLSRFKPQLDAYEKATGFRPDIEHDPLFNEKHPEKYPLFQDIQAYLEEHKGGK